MQQIIETGIQNKISLSIFCFGKEYGLCKTKLQKISQFRGMEILQNITTI